MSSKGAKRAAIMLSPTVPRAAERKVFMPEHGVHRHLPRNRAERRRAEKESKKQDARELDHR